MLVTAEEQSGTAGEEQDDAADYQHGGYGHRAFQQLFYCIVKQETQYQGRHNRHQQLYIELPFTEVEECFKELDELFFLEGG